MTKLREQLTRIIKFSNFMKEEMKQDEEEDLTIIDKSLDKAIDDKCKDTIENILGDK